MPRQIDLSPQNLSVNNDPNSQLGFTQEQIVNLNSQVPAALAKAQALAITNFLTLLDQETGLDLLGLWNDYLQFSASVSTSLQQSWLNLQSFLNGLAQETDADVAGALAWLSQQFNQLSAALQQSWLSFQSFLNGVVQEADADVAGAVAYLQGIGTAANDALTQIEDFLETGDFSDLTTAMQDILQSIFGSSTSLGLVGSIPAPAVVNVTQNLQPVWDFPDTQSVSAGGGWSWDGTVDHTGVAGSGSAKYTCNGTLGALRGIPGAVAPGQTVTPTAWVMWSGLTATGSPFQLELIPYSGSGSSLFAGTPVTVASVTSPGSSHAWEEITGTYTVPSSGVTAVQLRLVVTAGATAGSVWWDDCQCDVSGGFLADMQADTNNIIDSFAPGGTSAEFVTGATNLLALVGLTPASVGGATNLTALWTAIVNDFINPLNAIEISAVSGLASSLSALLGTTTFQSLLDGIANVMGHSGTGHTITNIETYLGLIPPTNVTSTTGGASLASDASAWNAIVTDLSGFLTTGSWTDLTHAWQDLINALYGTSGSSAPGAAVAVSAVPGLPTSKITSGTFSQSMVSGLTTTLNTLLPTTTYQSLVDAIANALGHTGTGHTWTDIETYFGIIPPANVGNVLGGSNLGADVSAVHSTATATSTNLTNTWSWLFGTTTPTSASTINQDVVDGLTDVWDWLTGSSTPPTSSSTAQVQPNAVPAVGNQANLLDAVQAGWDALVQAFTGVDTTGHSLGGLANAASSTATAASGALATAQSATMVQAQQATAKPGYMAIDSTMDAVFPLSHMIASPTYNTVTSAASTIGFIRTSDNISKLSVAFLGSYTGTLTTLKINVYSMNTTTGGMTQIVTGSNISSSIGTSLGWVYYTLPTPVIAAPGDVYAVQLSITGSGSVSLMGLSNSTFPQNSAVYPKALGAVSVAPTAPAHDATGGGSFTNTSTTSFSWSHTLGSSAAGIVIAFVTETSRSVSAVTVGGVAATRLGSQAFSGYTGYLYELLSPPVGAQTVTVTLSTAGNLTGNSDSYTGVSSFGTVATNSGSAGTASVSVSSATTQTAVAAMFNASGAFTSFNQTSRWNGGSGLNGVFGDAAGSSTVSFTATSPSTWGALGVSLIAASTPTYSTTVPWFGLGTSAISAVPAQAPVTASYYTPGTYTWTLPTWFKAGVDFLDVIAVGPGGGGGGGIGNPGASGSSSTVTVGGTTVTAAGGGGAAAGNTNSTGAQGASPGNQTYNGTTYYGGSVSYYSYGLVTNGSSPGGGGAGGGTSGTFGFGGGAGSWATQTFNPTGTTVSVTVGAAGAGSPFFGAESGADGAVWLVARQA